MLLHVFMLFFVFLSQKSFIYKFFLQMQPMATTKWCQLNLADVCHALQYHCVGLRAAHFCVLQQLNPGKMRCPRQAAHLLWLSVTPLLLHLSCLTSTLFQNSGWLLNPNTMGWRFIRPAVLLPSLPHSIVWWIPHIPDWFLCLVNTICTSLIWLSGEYYTYQTDFIVWWIPHIPGWFHCLVNTTLTRQISLSCEYHTYQTDSRCLCIW